MNKNIALVGAIILIAAAGWLLLGKNMAIAPTSLKTTGEQNNEADKQNSIQSESFSGTISDLINKKTPLKCAAEYDAGDKIQKQTIYFDGKNLRVEIDFDLPTGASNTYILIKDGWEYIWNETGMSGAANTGIKIKIGDPEHLEAAPNIGEGFDMQKIMDFDCRQWAADASLFEAPSSITFDDMTDTIQQALENAQSKMPSDACDACKMMSDETAQKQCQIVNQCVGTETVKTK